MFQKVVFAFFCMAGNRYFEKELGIIHYFEFDWIPYVEPSRAKHSRPASGCAEPTRKKKVLHVEGRAGHADQDDGPRTGPAFRCHPPPGLHVLSSVNLSASVSCRPRRITVLLLRVILVRHSSSVRKKLSSYFEEILHRALQRFALPRSLRHPLQRGQPDGPR